MVMPIPLLSECCIHYRLESFEMQRQPELLTSVWQSSLNLLQAEITPPSLRWPYLQNKHNANWLLPSVFLHFLSPLLALLKLCLTFQCTFSTFPLLPWFCWMPGRRNVLEELTHRAPSNGFGLRNVAPGRQSRVGKVILLLCVYYV